MSKKKANHARNFNSIMHHVHHLWAAEVLGMQVNPEEGPDLIDNDKIVEVKFTLVVPDKYPEAWTVLEHQMSYPQQYQRKGFWGLGKYWLKVPVEEIKTRSHERLEELVERREMYLVNWDWMIQFPPSSTSGRTEFSEWNNILRYPKARVLPQISKTYKVEKGLVHLIKGVDKRDFPILKP